MLLPYLDYADVVFHKSNSTDLDKLQRLQNRCLRICLGQDRRFSTDRTQKLASVPFQSDRHKAHTLNFMYLRKDKKNLLNKNEIRTRAHDAPLFNITIPRCEAYEHSVSYSGGTEWNNLDPAIRNTDSYLAFKYLQKTNRHLPLSRIELED